MYLFVTLSQRDASCVDSLSGHTSNCAFCRVNTDGLYGRFVAVWGGYALVSGWVCSLYNTGPD